MSETSGDLTERLMKAADSAHDDEDANAILDAKAERDRLRAALEAISDVDQLPKTCQEHDGDLHWFRLGELSAARLAREALDE